jgi:hypothetical protein
MDHNISPFKKKVWRFSHTSEVHIEKGRGVDTYRWERFALSWKVKVDIGLNLFHAPFTHTFVIRDDVTVFIIFGMM